VRNDGRVDAAALWHPVWFGPLRAEVGCEVAQAEALGADATAAVDRLRANRQSAEYRLAEAAQSCERARPDAAHDAARAR